VKIKILIIASSFFIFHSAFAFEGRIAAVMTRGGQTDALLYTVATNFLRVENIATNWPNPVDIVDLNSGELTLLFPNNHSFVRFKPAEENISTISPGAPAMSAVPSGIGSQIQSSPSPPNNIGPTNLPGMPAPPAIPQMPNVPPGMAGGIPALPIMPMPMEKIALTKTDDTTNILGLACARYELKQRGETMEIWATDKLFPFQPYMQNQPRRFRPRMIEEQWGDLLKAKKLFPLLAVLKFDNGTERFRFEIKSITPQKLKDEDMKLFQPPSDYFEIQPLPF
jgi:Domain of unknown function (DUF4412)